jgi:menaquinone-dependent protoporphyrinogen IX oxidase
MHVVKLDVRSQAKGHFMRDLFGAPSHELNFEEAVEVHLKLMEGWLQSRVAAFYDVNGGRISEINTGKRHPGSKAEALKRRWRAA